MSKENNARVCELYLEFDNINAEHAEAQHIIKDLLKSHNYSKALEVFLKLADKGDRIFQYNAGVLFQCIDEVRDYQSALSWYQKSVAQDFAPAKERLASMLEFGDGGVPVDLSTAIRLYRESSDQGNLNSTYNLGMILATGSDYIQQNLPVALRLLLQSANQGHALMKLNLGIVYQEKCNSAAEASHWFKLAFEQDPFVSIDLGNYYLSHYHQNCNEKSAALSHFWFATAIAYGYQDQVLEIFDGDQRALSAFKIQGHLH